MAAFSLCWLSAAACWLPAAALACPVCYDPRDPSQAAFVAGTALLTLVPVAAIAGVVAYVWRRSRAVERGDDPGRGPLP